MVKQPFALSIFLNIASMQRITHWSDMMTNNFGLMRIANLLDIMNMNKLFSQLSNLF